MLTACTITGLDARTDLLAVAALAIRRPIAEFGILFSRTMPGKDPRYPTPIEIDTMLGGLAARTDRVRLALHVCGSAVEEFVAGEASLLRLAERFGRVQLNFSAPKATFTMAALEEAIAAFPRPVITQENEANDLVKHAVSAPNHQLLFDASLGRGVRSVLGWPDAVRGKACGFAGGVGPDTIGEDVALAEAASGGADHWIDMEGRVRTDGWLDLGKVRRVLEGVDAAVSGRRDAA